jgi:hypothetical protein
MGYVQVGIYRSKHANLKKKHPARKFRVIVNQSVKFVLLLVLPKNQNQKQNKRSIQTFGYQSICIVNWPDRLQCKALFALCVVCKKNSPSFIPI